MSAHLVAFPDGNDVACTDGHDLDVVFRVFQFLVQRHQRAEIVGRFDGMPTA